MVFAYATPATRRPAPAAAGGCGLMIWQADTCSGFSFGSMSRRGNSRHAHHARGSLHLSLSAACAAPDRAACSDSKLGRNRYSDCTSCTTVLSDRAVVQVVTCRQASGGIRKKFPTRRSDEQHARPADKHERFGGNRTAPTTDHRRTPSPGDQPHANLVYMTRAKARHCGDMASRHHHIDKTTTAGLQHRGTCDGSANPA